MTDRDVPTAEHAERPVFRRIADGVREYLGADSSGHDMHHAFRVFDLGVRIAEVEGADVEVVGAAALTHDLHRAMGEGDGVSPGESLPAVRGVLEGTGFPEGKVPDVLHCVEVHDEYAFRGIERPAETIEAEVLRDADNLDAMGAVGIARSFAFTGVVGNPLWDPAGEEYSGLGHFHDKLLELEGEMNTATAREFAAGRHEFLEAFVERFRKEWYGEL